MGMACVDAPQSEMNLEKARTSRTNSDLMQNKQIHLDRDIAAGASSMG